MKLNTRLRALRERTGLTQVAFAKECNFDKTTYGKYELGKREPPIDRLLHIIAVLGKHGVETTMNYLCAGGAK